MTNIRTNSVETPSTPTLRAKVSTYKDRTCFHNAIPKRDAVSIVLILVFLPLVISSFVPRLSYGAGPELIVTLHADASNVLFGQYLIPLSDQDGDGCSELLVANGRFSTYLYFGGQTPDTVYGLRFDSTNTWGAEVGDLNDDGQVDLALLGRSSFGWKMNAYHGGPLIDTTRDAWFGVDSNPPCVNPTRTTDLNADGYDELLIVPCNLRSVQIYSLGPDSDSLPDLILHDLVLPSIQIGAWARQIAVGDFNGDGLQDLVVAQTPQSLSGLNGRLHFFWGGADFDSVPDFTIVRQGANSDDYDLFGSVMTCPGDLNGDGYDDVFVASAGIDDTAWVYFGGSNIDTNPDIKIPLYIKHAVPAGDINGDGYDDLLASYDVSFSGDGRVYVFYGGPQFNGQWDIRIANWEDSIYQTNFGMAIAGLGDYNGDGVDDFAFSAMGSSSRGVVYIYSGTGVPVDVPVEEHGDGIDGTSLDGTYPNPFNQSTIINFRIPRRSHVKLTINDVLGRVVATLVDVSLASGKHSVEWNAASSGRAFASGVYYCLLEFENTRIGRKVVLLK